MHDLHAFRRAKDASFSGDPGSLLTTEQRPVFTGLGYFPENPDLRLEVRVIPSADHAPVQVGTSTGDVQLYHRIGRFSFEVAGERADLKIFSGSPGPFLAFADSLAGSETYPAGRYLEPEPLPGNRYLVDFNLAYNP